MFDQKDTPYTTAYRVLLFVQQSLFQWESNSLHKLMFQLLNWSYLMIGYQLQGRKVTVCYEPPMVCYIFNRQSFYLSFPMASCSIEQLTAFEIQKPKKFTSLD